MKILLIIWRISDYQKDPKHQVNSDIIKFGTHNL